MRPRFSVDLSQSADDVMHCIREKIEQEKNLRCLGTSARRCAELFVDELERRIWSPHLSIQVQDTPSGSVLSGRFSPRPEVWTLIMFIYFLMGFAVVFGSSFGYVQWLTGNTPWGLVAVPAGMLVIAVLHVASIVGQRLSGDQMELLRERLDDILECASDPEARVGGGDAS
jgi:hypothetical protein